MPRPRRLLLTGFEPFGGSTVNPSQRVVEQIAGSSEHDPAIAPLVLPVVGTVAPRRLVAAIRRLRPAAVLMLGESAMATAITIEVVAVNLRDYRIADNQGRVVQERPVVKGGPAAYFSTLPLQWIRKDLHAHGIPAVFSMSAGTYLCNEVMYAALHELRTQLVPCGFVHLPRLPEQVLSERAAPSMELSMMVRAVERIIAVLTR